MKATPIRRVARYVGGWGTVIGFVVLLTLIFSFLGTIICAVLAGMMLGPAKLGRGHTVAVSLVFPSVISILLRTSRAELPGSQVVLLALLCFGAFWLSYTVATAVLFCESNQHTTPGAKAGRGAVAIPIPKQATIEPPTFTQASECGAEQPLSLATLQGKWSCEPVNGESAVTRKVMQITEEQLVLSLLDPQGRTSRFATGQVRVLSLAGLPTLTVSATETQSAPDPMISI